MEAALAAGVLLCLVPESTLMLTRATMLSPEGRSKTLDASADGYVRGETCRALYLRPTANAAQQAQQALGLLLSSAVNTNGRASSLTAPNGPAQQALLRDALATAGVRGADVAGLQMHSNGTALGDPIEVGAASAVYLVSLILACTHEALTWQDGMGQPLQHLSPVLLRSALQLCRRVHSASAGRSCLPPSRASPGTRSRVLAWRAYRQPACWSRRRRHLQHCTCGT